MNLVFWALRRSRFEDIQSARAPIAWCMERAAPLPRWKGNANMPGCHRHTAGLIPHRKIKECQYQKCRVDIVREPLFSVPLRSWGDVVLFFVVVVSFRM